MNGSPFELLSAGNWQYPGLWPHPKNGFPHASIIPSIRPEIVGIQAYVLEGDGKQKVPRHQPAFRHAWSWSVRYLQGGPLGML